MCVYVAEAWLYNSLELCSVVLDIYAGCLQSNRDRENKKKREKANPHVEIFQARCAQCAGAMATADLLHPTSQTIPSRHAITLSDHINLKSIIRWLTQSTDCVRQLTVTCIQRHFIYM